MRVFHGVDELREAVGTSLGRSDWVTLDQAQVDLFAEATGDRQWIHVDRERAGSGPFGTTIAHGFLTLALLPVIGSQVYRVGGVALAVNYGLNRVRFTAPVPVGSKLRGSVELVAVTDVDGGVQVATTVTVELAGSAKPALVAESLVRYYL